MPAGCGEEIDLEARLRDPVRLYYAVIGLSTAPFTLAPEFRQLSGLDPFAPEQVDGTIAYVEALLFLSGKGD